MMDAIHSMTLERTSNAIATGAVVSPIWLPYLQNVSEIAALLLPIAGVCWLVLQMVFYIMKEKK